MLNTFNLQEMIKSNTVNLHKSKMNHFSVSFSLLTSEICLCISSSSSFHVISLSVAHSLRKTRSNSTVEYTLYSCCNYREKYRRIDTPGGGWESRIKKQRVGKCGVWFLESEGVKNIVIVHFLSLRPFRLSI